MHSTLASNAIVVVLATTVAYAERDSHNGTLFTLVGPIPSGLPTPQAPSIDPARFQVSNTIIDECPFNQFDRHRISGLEPWWLR